LVNCLWLKARSLKLAAFKIKILVMKTYQLGNVFIENDEIDWEDTEQGIQRKIMAYDDRVMLVKVKFKTGGIGILHQHTHTQLSYVESGIFEIEIGGKKKILKGGDAFFIPPNTLHGAICIQKGILVDVFSPMREDFIK